MKGAEIWQVRRVSGKLKTRIIFQKEDGYWSCIYSFDIWDIFLQSCFAQMGTLSKKEMVAAMHRYDAQGIPDGPAELIGEVLA